MLHKRVKDIRGDVGDICILPSLTSSHSESTNVKSSNSPTNSTAGSAIKYQSYDMMRNIFSVFDRDNDGYIRHAELRLLFNDLGYNVTIDDVDHIIKSTGSKGCITFDEFIEMMMVETPEEKENNGFFPSTSNPFEDPFTIEHTKTSPTKISPNSPSNSSSNTLFQRTPPRNIPSSPSSRLSPTGQYHSPPTNSSSRNNVHSPSSPNQLSPITRGRAASLAPSYGSPPKVNFTKRVLSKNTLNISPTSNNSNHNLNNNLNNEGQPFNLFEALRKRIPLFKPLNEGALQPPIATPTLRKPPETLKLPSIDARSRRNSSPAVPILENQPSNGGFVGVSQSPSKERRVKKGHSQNHVNQITSTSLSDLHTGKVSTSTDYGTSHTRDELRDAFELFDNNNDGKVSKNEMRNVMKKMGLSMIMSDYELDQLFGMVDADGDGNINFDQFVQLFLM